MIKEVWQVHLLSKERKTCRWSRWEKLVMLGWMGWTWLYMPAPQLIDFNISMTSWAACSSILEACWRRRPATVTFALIPICLSIPSSVSQHKCWRELSLLLDYFLPTDDKKLLMLEVREWIHRCCLREDLTSQCVRWETQALRSHFPASHPRSCSHPAPAAWLHPGWQQMTLPWRPLTTPHLPRSLAGTSSS